MRIELSELDETIRRILEWGCDRAFIECRAVEGEIGQQLHRISVWRAHQGKFKLECLMEFLELDCNQKDAIEKIEARLLSMYKDKNGERDPLGVLDSRQA